MEFRIADTFTDSLARLTGDEQKSVKTTVFDLQVNPSQPGLQFHKLDKAKDKRFWSARVSGDIRLIVHRTETSLLLCYVAHHDPAYHWAERRKLETHPRTGAAQLVEIRETVQEITVPKYVEEVAAPPAPPKPLLFAGLTDEALLSYGVPTEWLGDVRKANEDSVLTLAGHLPAEAAEALLELATGATPKAPEPAAAGSDPFAHPDAQRRFRVMTNVEELQRALEFPWDKWTIFLHPAQRGLVERNYAGPARVAGSAGTGKTIVALHRAVFLARRHPDARVLLTTFSEALASALRGKLRCLINHEPRLAERLEVQSMDSVGQRLYEAHVGRAKIATPAVVRQLLQDAAAQTAGQPFSLQFLLTEWEQIADAWQLDTWEAYRDVVRLGRKTRLKEAHRAMLWAIFDRVRTRLQAQGLVTPAGIFTQAAAALAKSAHPPFEFAVIDEAQDVTVPQLRFLAALGGSRPGALFFAGDLGQRIFQPPFSWKSLGVDVRGRSFTLRINYRTSHQIRAQADRLLGPSVSDVDGIEDKRKGTVSTFNGPPPEVVIAASETAEQQTVSAWLRQRLAEGVVPHEIGIFVRSEAELARAKAAAEAAQLPHKVLDEHVETTTGKAAISTMHLAKGLEFRTVVVMACDDDVIPLQARIESVTEDSDLEEVYNTERHLLYVACTRARDHLLTTAVKPGSEFLGDMHEK